MRSSTALGGAILAAALFPFPSPASAQLGLMPEATLTIPMTGTSIGLGGAVALSSDGLRAVAARGLAGTTGHARVFVRTGATWAEEGALEPADVAGGDVYGSAVGMDAMGLRVIVGSQEDSIAGNPAGFTGSARVFVRTGSTWTFESLLVPRAFGDTSANFGHAVAISGDGTRAVVGAYLEDTPAGINAGAAHVFVRTGTTWAEEAVIYAPSAAPADGFGNAVSIDSTGDRLIVGGSQVSRGLGSEGAAYVYTRAGSGWALEATLTHPMPGHDDQFGTAVSLSSDATRAFVTAYVDDVPGVGDDAGSGHVFVRSGTTWTLEATLLGAMAGPFDHIGRSGAISGAGDIIVMGGELDGGSSMGRLHVFQRTGTTWGAPNIGSTTGILTNFLLGMTVAISSDGTRVISGTEGDLSGFGTTRVFTVGPDVVPVDAGMADAGTTSTDAGTAGVDAGTGMDAGTTGTDSGTTTADTGTAVDSGRGGSDASGGNDGGTTMPPTGGGGGCSVAARTSSTPLVLALAALALLIARRARR